MGAPMSASTPWSCPSPSAPAAQTMLSAPPPVVVAIVEPRPVIAAHQAVETATGPVVTRNPTMLFADPGQPAPEPVNATKVPEGVVIADGAVTMGAFATARLTTVAEPIPPRLLRSAR